MDEINKEMQTKMEFILNHQAQFAANIQAHDERFAKLENIVTRLANATLSGQEDFNAKVSAITDAQIQTEGTLGKLADSQTRLAESHAKLAESQAKLAESQAKLAESQARLAESQTHTDKRLDALIDIVREDREDRNGKS